MIGVLMQTSLYASDDIQNQAKSRIRSVIHGRDSEVLNSMIPFYRRPSGPIVDVTCNERRMWKGVDYPHISCDKDQSVNPDVLCDFTSLPFKSGTVSLLIFDPPHLPAAAASEKSLKPFARRYGLGTTSLKNNIHPLFEPFLQEASRVLMADGLIFAKLCDYVHNHKYQWMQVEFVQAVFNVSGLTATDMIIKEDPCGGNLSSGRWVNSHHARRSHSWWIVVRKGKCEPAKGW
jgi:hypothetical protein